MAKKAKQTTMNALLLAWWIGKQGQDQLTWWDAGILSGLALCWLLEQKIRK